MRRFQTLGIDMVAIAEPRREVLSEAGEMFGIPALYTDHHKMLKECKPDAVLVSTPNAFHGPLACDAMKAGADVLVEKPLSATLAQARRVVATEERTGRFTMVGFQCREMPAVRLAREMAEAGKLGQVYHCDIEYMRRKLINHGTWFSNKKFSGGGAVLDLGCHALDMGLSIMGFPTPVQVMAGVHTRFGNRRRGKGRNPKNKFGATGVFDVEDFATATLLFENGATVAFRCCWSAHTDEAGAAVHVYGDKAGCRVRGGKLEVFTEEMGQSLDRIPHLADSPYAENQTRQFVEAIGKGGHPRPTAREGLLVQALMDAMYRSAESGKSVKVRL